MVANLQTEVAPQNTDTDARAEWYPALGDPVAAEQVVMEKQVSSLNTLWLVQCIRTSCPEVDVPRIARETFEKGPFFIENLRTGRSEPVGVVHLEGTDYWFSNSFMMALYDTIEEYIDDPAFAYKCGATFYKTQSRLKTAVGVPLIGPYRLIKKIVSENHKYNKTKQATIRSLKKGYTAVRIIHKPGIVMDDFGMNWYLGMLESYARLAGLTNIIGKMTCVERGPQQYGHPGQAIYDFEITFKDPGFLQRIFNLMLYAVPAVRELIESTEFIQAKHNDQIIHRDKIIKERTDHLLGIQKKLMDAERINIERKLENLSFELITTEERERKAIAEDLHDSVTQLLALSVSSLKGYNRENPGQTVTKEVQEYLQTALADTRSLTFQISPPVLYDFGLEAALEWLVSDICMRHPIEMDFFNLLDQPLLLNDFQKATLYRSVREAVINCIKHAKAKYASVALHVEDGKTRIDIEDNGIGFDPINLKRGFGLSALGDRLQNIGAGIDIISSPGEGSLIKIFLPEEKKIAFKNE